VGLAKRDFIDREIEAPVLDLMRDIKRQFDPAGILNPGKGFPEASSSASRCG
jgi:D-lactate dehydrogenase